MSVSETPCCSVEGCTRVATEKIRDGVWLNLLSVCEAHAEELHRNAAVYIITQEIKKTTQAWKEGYAAGFSAGKLPAKPEAETEAAATLAARVANERAFENEKLRPVWKTVKTQKVHAFLGLDEEIPDPTPFFDGYRIALGEEQFHRVVIEKATVTVDEYHPDAAPVICPVCLRERLVGDIHGEGVCVREIITPHSPSWHSVLDERIDRIDNAVESLAWFLVAKQSLVERDARAIEGILNGTAPSIATERNTVSDPERAPAQTTRPSHVR